MVVSSIAPLVEKPALLMTASKRAALLRIPSTHVLTETSSSTSMGSISMPLLVVEAVARRPAPNTRQPRDAKCSAHACPMPAVAPVINTTFLGGVRSAMGTSSTSSQGLSLKGHN